MQHEQSLCPESFTMRTGLATDQHRQSAQVLSALIYRMALEETNILLQLFGPHTTVYTEKKYPEQPLKLAQGRLQAFYHTHDTQLAHANEHGHFHIFIRENTDSGKSVSHVAGLSMDHFGQPVGWFTVNQWVTSGVCYNTELLINALDQIDCDSEDGLIEQWLLAMLKFYRQEISHLLDTSLLRLENMCMENDASLASIMCNRDIYFIDDRSIDLGHDLAAISLL